MKRSLLITTGIGCSNLCAYCPQVTLENAYAKISHIKKMKLDTFEKCLDKLNNDVHIHFNGFTEPWLNPECTKMILYAYKHKFSIKVSTTLMGMEFEDINLIKNIPFIKFAVHLPDDKGLTKIAVNEKYLSILTKLIDSNINNTVFHIHKGISGPENAHYKVMRILRENNITPDNRWIITRAGNIEIEGIPSRKKLTCDLLKCYRLNMNVLLPNGDVALCCMDWGLNHIIGNLLNMDYDMLFQTDEYNKIIRGYSDETLNILCRYCEIAKPKSSSRLKKFKTLFQKLKNA